MINYSLINSNTSLPASQSELFSTRSDNEGLPTTSSLKLSPFTPDPRTSSKLKREEQSKLLRIHMFKIGSRESTPSKDKGNGYYDLSLDPEAPPMEQRIVEFLQREGVHMSHPSEQKQGLMRKNSFTSALKYMGDGRRPDKRVSGKSLFCPSARLSSDQFTDQEDIADEVEGLEEDNATSFMQLNSSPVHNNSLLLKRAKMKKTGSLDCSLIS